MSVPVIIAVKADTMDLFWKNPRVGCGEPAPSYYICDALGRRWEGCGARKKIGAAGNALANKSVESGVPTRVAPRPYGKARPEGPSPRGTVFILRPAGPKVEARRAEAKFCVWLICGNTVAS